MAKTSLVYPLDIERDSCYYVSEAEGEPTPPTSDQPLDYGKELIDMQNTIETKVCTKCNEAKPLSEYGKHKAAKDGLRHVCKPCRKSASRAYYEANREKVLASKEAYREANREKHNSASRAYYEANREKLASYHKAYYEANREKILAERKAYHAEKWADDPEYRTRLVAAVIRRRRLLASAVQEPYTREEIFERDNWTCQLCQEPIDSKLRYPDSESASIDHIVPISHGGDDTPDNVQSAHLTCNQGKGNRVELELEEAA